VGGIPHSDESLPSLEERIALGRVMSELPPRAVAEAMCFRGYLKGRLCGGPPPAFRFAVIQFQKAFGFEPTGFPSPSQQVLLIKMAADAGDAIAQDRLGIMYAKGIGVARNFVRAEYWFIKAANQGFPDAYYNLYVLYKVGPNGIEPDEHKAVSYATRAIAALYNPASCELLYLLDQPDGPGRDRPGRGRR
jgi:TPR repeat protein